jgi:hypothetical protein
MINYRFVKVWRQSKYGENINIENWPVFTKEQLKKEIYKLLCLYTKEEIEGGISLYIKHINESGDPVFDKGIDTVGLTFCQVIDNIKQGLYDYNNVYNITTANLRILS